MTEVPERLPYESLLAVGYRVAPFVVERMLYIRERLFFRQIGQHQWRPLNGFLKGVAPEGVTVLDWHDRPRSEWGVLVQDIVLQENIVAVHIHHCVPLYAALPVIRRKLPWVRTYDSTHIVEHMDRGFVRISGVWSGYLDWSHVISRKLVNFYRDRFDRPVDLGRMIEWRRAKPVRMQPQQTALRVAFVGRMAYQKRPVTALWAMARLMRWGRKCGVDLRFDMVGEGPFLRFVRQIAEAKGLSDRITFHPSGADVRAVLQGADILILPSANEGLALVAIEAVEEGVIPIATDVGAMGELLSRDLLTSPEPGQTVRGIVRIVERLWRDAGFLEKQALTLRKNLEALAAEPSAKDVITGYYREAMGVK